MITASMTALPQNLYTGPKRGSIGREQFDVVLTVFFRSIYAKSLLGYLKLGSSIAKAAMILKVNIPLLAIKSGSSPRHGP